MHKVLLWAIVAAAVLLVYPSLMMPEQSIAQTTDQNATTPSEITNPGIQCNTAATSRTGAFLTIDGIVGTNGMPCVFEVKDFSFGVENPTTIGSATGGAGAGKVSFHEIQITKPTDTSSPILFNHMVSGQHFKEVILKMRKAGGDPTSAGQAFLTFKFDTVFTTKIDWSGPGDEGPEESITFVYGKLAIEYKPIDSNSKPNGLPILSCFDSIFNKVC